MSITLLDIQRRFYHSARARHLAIQALRRIGFNSFITGTRKGYRPFGLVYAVIPGQFEVRIKDVDHTGMPVFNEEVFA